MDWFMVMFTGLTMVFSLSCVALAVYITHDQDTKKFALFGASMFFFVVGTVVTDGESSMSYFATYGIALILVTVSTGILSIRRNQLESKISTSDYEEDI